MEEGTGSSPALVPHEEEASAGPAKPEPRTDKKDFANPTLNIVQGASISTTTEGAHGSNAPISREGTPPPLPPRPRTLALRDSPSRPSSSHSLMPSRPQLQSKPTTQLSYVDTQKYSEELRDESVSSGTSRQAKSYGGLNASDMEDSASVRSFAPTVEAGGDTESILGEVIADPTLLQSLGHRFATPSTASLFPADAAFEDAFAREFDEIEGMKTDGSNEGQTTHLSVGTTELLCADSICVYRSGFAAMARKIKTLPNSVLGWETHLQPPR